VSSAIHLRCVKPYSAIVAKHLLDEYTIEYYANEPLPPAFDRCASCQQKFYRSPKRQR